MTDEDSRQKQSVDLMIQHHKTTIFLEIEESATILELKWMVQGILKWPPEEQLLYKENQLLDDGKTVAECGLNQRARTYAPAEVRLVFRGKCPNHLGHFLPFCLEWMNKDPSG